MLLLLACADPPDSADTAEALAPWQDVAENLPGAITSIWGDSADDVYVVGADAGAGPMAYHLAGVAWTPIEGLGSGDLWWVSGDAARVWMAGAGGRVFRLDRATATLESWVLDEALTFYGAWGPGDGTAWVVGGNTDVPSDAAAAYYFDGRDWSLAALPPEVAAQYALYKAWGASATDAWAVGSGGVSMHWDGDAWAHVDTLSFANLFTVHDGLAVGGSTSGTILALSSTGMTWTDETPDFAPALSGVYGGEQPVAVGATGSVYFRDDDAWVADAREKPTYQDLHAAWVDPEGGTWAVGGHTSAAPLIQGAIVYTGPRDLPVLE
ncbi:MAG: hypothetical protein FJ102_19470 [Deltaproteobacteria bacterium]|nr:hypothetical protein [Deltaproteobacteria bacterium]